MLFAFTRRLFLTLITLVILTLISYNILMRDPLNHFVDLQGASAYFSYVKGLLIGDFGISYRNGEPIFNQVLTVFPASISLSITALILSLIVGLPLGFLATLYRKHWLGKTLYTLGTFYLAIPVMWLAIIALYYSSVNQWEIAAVGELNPIYEIPHQTGLRIIDVFLDDSEHRIKIIQSMLHHLTLPAMILALPATLETIRFTYERVEYVAKQNYVKAAYTRGWSSFRIWYVHILHNTLPALIPMIARNLMFIFTFGMIVENIFSWGGIGLWLINALAAQDYNAISAGVVAIGIFVILINLAVGIMTTLLDPHQKKDWYVK